MIISGELCFSIAEWGPEAQLCEDTEPRHIQSQGLNSGLTNSPGSFHTFQGGSQAELSHLEEFARRTGPCLEPASCGWLPGLLFSEAPFLQVSATAHGERALSASERRDDHRFLDPGSPGVGPPPRSIAPDSLLLVVWAAWHFRAAAIDRLLTMRWLSALSPCSSQFRGGRGHRSHPVLDEEWAPGGEATYWPVIRDGDTCAHKGRMSFPQEAECPCQSSYSKSGGWGGRGQSPLCLEPGE